VRWRSPVGNIRLDIANAVSEPDRPWRIHFTLGPDF
jgi:translocation and assembly module TamA